MKTIEEVVELMRYSDYGIGVSTEKEIEKVLNTLESNGFKVRDCLRTNLAVALNQITFGERVGDVIELFIDCSDIVGYVYTNKQAFDSNGERISGEGILFTFIEFPDTKPIDLLRNFDIVTVEDDGTEVEGIYYNGFLYTPFLTLDRFDDDLVEKVAGYPATINKIVRENETIWKRKPSIKELELGTKVKVKLKVKLMSGNIEVNGTIINSDGERLILFDNYTTSKGLEEEKDYKLIEIYE